MGSNRPNKTTIWVDRTTKAALDVIRHPGQTYDGLLRELLVSFWKGKATGKDEKL